MKIFRINSYALSLVLMTVIFAAALGLTPLSTAYADGNEGSKVRFVVTLEDTDLHVRTALHGLSPLSPGQGFGVTVTATVDGAPLASKTASVNAEFPNFVDKSETDKYVVRLKGDILIVRYKNIATDDTLPHTVTVQITSSESGLQIVNLTQTIGGPGFQ